MQARTGREVNKHRGDYGGFGGTLRTKFKRSNQPFTMQWAAGGTSQQYDKVSPDQAALWLAVSGTPSDSTGLSDIPSTTP